MKNMNIHQGIVIDHLPANSALTILRYMEEYVKGCKLAVIVNTQSGRCGVKDMLIVETSKLQCLSILALLAPHCTVNEVDNDVIIKKYQPQLPARLAGKQQCGHIECKNIRCVTTVESSLDQVFLLNNYGKDTYHCMYCDTPITL